MKASLIKYTRLFAVVTAFASFAAMGTSCSDNDGAAEEAAEEVGEAVDDAADAVKDATN